MTVVSLSLVSLQTQSMAVNEGRLALAIISCFITGYIKFLSADLYFRHKTLFNTMTVGTYYLGILSAIAKLFYESEDVRYPSAVQLGEVAIAVAMALHETLVVWRFTILMAGRLSYSKYRWVAWVSIWITCLFRVIMEFVVPTQQTDLALSTDPTAIAAKLTSSYMFYGYVAIMDILISAFTLRYIYEVKKQLMESRTESKAIRLFESTTRIIGVELLIAVFALFLNIPYPDASSTWTGITKPFTDVCIYCAGLCAFEYSSLLLTLIKYKPSQAGNQYAMSKNAAIAGGVGGRRVSSKIQASANMNQQQQQQPKLESVIEEVGPKEADVGQP